MKVSIPKFIQTSGLWEVPRVSLWPTWQTLSLPLPHELHHCNRDKEGKKLYVLPALKTHQFVPFNYFLLALQWVKDTSMLQHLGFMMCFLKRKSKWK